MTDTIRQQVLEVLARENKAGPLSEKLFGPQGLFSQVARTADERQRLLQDALYRQAMARFMTVQRSEARTFEESLASGSAVERERSGSGVIK
jgi:hypothetical protein